MIKKAALDILKILAVVILIFGSPMLGLYIIHQPQSKLHFSTLRMQSVSQGEFRKYQTPIKAQWGRKDFGGDIFVFEPIGKSCGFVKTRLFIGHITDILSGKGGYPNVFIGGSDCKVRLTRSI